MEKLGVADLNTHTYTQMRLYLGNTNWPSSSEGKASVVKDAVLIEAEATTELDIVFP